MPEPSTILIVDDEPAIVDALRYNLEKAHYRVLVARDGERALQLAMQAGPDLIVLDIMLPGIDGLEVCRRIRASSQVPIIMLTARDEEVDRVVGLEIGADDYVVKPFSMRELMARLKAVLRRSETSPDPAARVLTLGRLRVDPSRYEACWDSTQIRLSPLEFQLLEAMVAHPGQVFTRDQLLDSVWGYDYHGESRAVDTAIRRLRARLREVSAEAADLLVTVHGVGYRLRDD
jgi:two-component system alkaline phosphatase synthesis response regulator PhoP